MARMLDREPEQQGDAQSVARRRAYTKASIRDEPGGRVENGIRFEDGRGIHSLLHVQYSLQG